MQQLMIGLLLSAVAACVSAQTQAQGANLAPAQVASTVPSDQKLAAIAELSKAQVQPYLETLKQLVSIESGSRDLEGLAKVRGVVEEQLKAMDIQFEVITPPAQSNTGAMVRAVIPGKGKAKIALIAHMDTVYQRGDLAKQPFKIDGDKVFGLGIADDKGGVAMVLHTLRMIKALKIDDFAQLTVLINGDEEIGSPSSRDYFKALGRENDVVISFEGSGAKSDYVRLATSSIARVSMTVKGRAAHSGANPDFGRNALYEMSHQILQTRDLSDPSKGVKFNGTLGRAGTVANMIPPDAKATADVRAERTVDFDEVERTLNERIKNKLIPDTEVLLEFVRTRPPLNPTDKGREVAKQAQQIAKEISWKLDVLEKATGGGTDAAFASLEAKGAVIESFGPQGFGAHTDNAEYIVLASIQPRLYITTRLIQDLSKP